MYTPPAYREDNIDFLHQLMREWSFATIVSHGADGLLATHLPFLVEGRGAYGKGRLVAHIARNNPQWCHFATGDEAMVIFQGPHAFISVNWYDNRNTFPTWNYGSIHCYGKVRLIEEPEAVRGILQQTIAVYDTPLGGDWKFAKMPANMTEPRLRAIIGMVIEIERIEGKLKFNQDKSEADRKGVVAALEADEEGKPAAQFMERLDDYYRSK